MVSSRLEFCESIDDPGSCVEFPDAFHAYIKHAHAFTQYLKLALFFQLPTYRKMLAEA
jgi:hypothetical protein